MTNGTSTQSLHAASGEAQAPRQELPTSSVREPDALDVVVADIRSRYSFDGFDDLSDADWDVIKRAIEAGASLPFDAGVASFVGTVYYLAAMALAGADAAEADEYLNRLDRYANLPNAISGFLKKPAAEALEQPALMVVTRPETIAEYNAQGDWALNIEFWLLAILAARADIGVLDTLAAVIEGERETKLIAQIRRGTKRYNTQNA